jgi:ABC-type multidrug transport system ATPase subunit
MLTLLEVEMLCDKIAIIKDGRIQIACKVNQLLHVVGGYVIKIYLKRANKKSKKKFHKKKKLKSQSFNNRNKAYLFNSTAAELNNPNKNYMFEVPNKNDSEFFENQLRQEKSFENALDLFSQLKQKQRKGSGNSHLIKMNHGKYLVDTEELVKLISGM